MRAYEFIIEARKVAKPTEIQSIASVGMSKFRDPGGYDRTYELNRIMMAVACTDGLSPVEMDAESWAGRYNTAHPFTEVEAQMLKQAYKAVGSELFDLNNGDFQSRELENTNVKSIVKPFKGYPK